MTDPELSDLDKRIIVALQRNGRASWREIAATLGSPAATVSRRGQALLDEGVVKVVVLPAVGAHGPYDQFWVRINCEPGRALEVAESLVSNPEVRFLAAVSGEYDLVAEIILHGGPDSYPRVIGALQNIDGIVSWRSDLMIKVYKIGFDWARQVFGDMFGEEPGPALSGPELRGECGPAHFDDLDRQILAHLADNGRQKFQAIANALGTSESSVRRRFDRMRDCECIDVLTVVPSAALGMGAETMMTVHVHPALIEQVADQLITHPQVRFCGMVLAENAIQTEVITTSTTALYDFIKREVGPLEGVTGWSAILELLTIKRSYAETPWWRRQFDASQIRR